MNRYAAAGDHETTSQPHHELLDQIGQLEHRERVLIGENYQLRAQLVEMKKQEKKKYDDLMVQYYNMKREYEDDGLDNLGTSNNQVTVKTEWDDDEVKQEIKEEDEEDRDIFIKREYEDDGTSTNTDNVTFNIKAESDDGEVKQEIKEEGEEDHDIFIKQEYVPEYIKTESNDEDVKDIIKDVIKQEIKVEYDEDDHNDDYGFDRCIVKKDDETSDEENGEMIPNDREELNDNRNESLPEESNGTNQGSVNDQPIDQHVGKGDELSELAKDECNQSQTSKQSKIRKRKRTGKSLATENENLLENSLPNREVSTQITIPKSKRIRVTSPLETETTKQLSTGSRVDLSKGDDPNGNESSGEVEIGVEQSEDEESWWDSETELGDDEDDEGGRYKIRTIKLKCIEDGCNAEVSNRVELHDHLRNEHNISPYRCLAVECLERFEQCTELGPHVRDNHSNISTWSCPHCTKAFKSQHLLYMHLHFNHFEGQFKCGYDGCHYDRVATFRSEIKSHQQSVHPNSTIYTCQFINCGKSFNRKDNFNVHQQIHTGVKPFRCGWTGCGMSFTTKSNLNKHQRIHQKVKPYKCTWNRCDYASTQHNNVIKHIRTQHFRLPKTQKKQHQLGIEDNRDPRVYLLNTITHQSDHNSTHSDDSDH